MGGMGHFIEIKEHTYRYLTLEFLSTLHVEVTQGPQCQVWYISFYLQAQFYELNLGTFNSIFGIPPSMGLPNCQVSSPPENSTRMHFGARFQGVLGTALVLPSAPTLGALAFEGLNVFLFVVFLLGMIT